MSLSYQTRNFPPAVVLCRLNCSHIALTMVERDGLLCSLSCHRKHSLEFVDSYDGAHVHHFLESDTVFRLSNKRSYRVPTLYEELNSPTMPVIFP